MGYMQDRVPPDPTTRSKTARGTHCACFYFIMHFYLLVEAESQLHVMCRATRAKPARAASLQQFHFAHWLLSWVLCDCNWLESFKLASPCQPLKALKSWGSIQLSAGWSLIACWVEEPQRGERPSSGFAPVTVPQGTGALCVGRWLCLKSFPFCHWSRFGEKRVVGLTNGGGESERKWERGWSEGSRESGGRKSRKGTNEKGSRIEDGRSFVNIDVWFLCNWIWCLGMELTDRA